MLGYIRPYAWLVALSLLLAALTVALTLYFPILTGDAIDCILAPGQVDFASVAKIAARMAVVVALTSLAQWLLSLCNNHIAYGTVRGLRDAAFAHIERLPLKCLDAHAHGELVSRVIADADQFSEGLLMGFTQLFTCLLYTSRCV